MVSDTIIVKNLTVNYDRKTAIWDVNFAVKKGSLACIIGPNGAGKSSLMKAMLGLLPSLSGEISFFGRSREEMRGRLAYVGQRTSVDWDFPITVFEVILMGVYGNLALMQRPSRKDKEKAEKILEKLGMTEFKHTQIGDLSGGQQQRVFIGRALMQDADVYFFDEPFVCIDMTTEKLIVEILKELSLQGKTVFVVHHDLHTVSRYFDFVIMLHLRVVAVGPVETTYHRENLKKTFGEASSFLEEMVLLTGKRQDGLV